MTMRLLRGNKAMLAYVGVALALFGCSSSSMGDSPAENGSALCPCESDAAVDAGSIAFPDPSRPACESVALCCGSRSDAELMRCAGAVTAKDENACAQLIVEYQGKNYCPSRLGAPDAGKSSTAPAMCACPAKSGSPGPGPYLGGPGSPGPVGGPSGAGDAGASTVSPECQTYAAKWIACYESAGGMPPSDLTGAEQTCETERSSCPALIACFNAAADCNRSGGCDIGTLCH